MHCLSCGFDNATGLKFCGNCGTALKLRCRNCGFDNAPGIKFCGECGKALVETPAPPDPRSYTPKHLAEKILTSRSALEGERKQVTVLFADLKGSMDLSEAIDPEEWHRIMGRFFGILTDGVHRFEGTVNQYTGDGMMALFGAPIAHEDHAARACYTALALQDDLRRYANELRIGKGINFSVRMGLNSGEVVVGKIGDDLRMDYTALGHTANLAARMEQIAEPGKAYLTEHTARLAQGLLQLQDLGKLAIKGVKEPVGVYELQGIGRLHTKLEVSRARGFSKFVGRDREMAVLDDALERTLGGNGQVVGIVADPGVGKSRLCFEFLERRRAEGLRIQQAHGVSYGKAIPFLPILELFRNFFAIDEKEPSDLAREKIAGRLLLLDQCLVESLSLVFDFLGVSDPTQPSPAMDPEVRQQRFYAVVKQVTQLSGRREPSVTFLEDLHWFDGGSDGLLEAIVEGLPGGRMLVLVNFRPEYHARWMQKSYYHQLPLAPLSREAIQQLLRELLGTDPSVARLGALVTERTGGNPFFMEETVQMLAEDGHLDGVRGAYRLVTEADSLAVPDTVQAVLAARIDRLPEAEKHVLQAASVVGKTFPQSILSRVVELEETRLRLALETLTRAELLYETALYPESEYAFKHPLTQEVAYASQLRERRMKSHAAAARTIAELDADKLDERAAVLAYHWEGAGAALEAARWHRRAADWAGLNDPRTPIKHWHKVRGLLEAEPESAETLELGLRARGAILSWGIWLGDPEELAAKLLAEGRALAARAKNPRLLSPLVQGYGAIRGFAGDLAEYRERSREAVTLADEVGDALLRVAARSAFSYSLYCSGLLQDAMVFAEEGCNLRSDDPGTGMNLLAFPPRVGVRMVRGLILTEVGRLDDAAAQLETAASLDERQGSSQAQRWISTSRCRVATYQGDVAASLQWASRVTQVAESIGSPFDRVWARLVLGEAQILAASFAEAEEALRRSIALARENRTGVQFEGLALAGLSRALLGLGEDRQAREAAEQAVASAQRIGTRTWEASARLALAHVLIDTEGATAGPAISAELDRAKILIQETGGRTYEPFLHLEQAGLAEAMGDAACERSLREAHRLFIEIGAPLRAERVARQVRAEKEARS